MKELKVIRAVSLCVSLTMGVITQASLFKKCDLRVKENLKLNSFDNCSQSKLDAFYKEIDAGSKIPDGIFNGNVQISSRESKIKIIQKIRDIFPDYSQDIEESILERIWAGKIFYRQNSNSAILFNRIRTLQQMRFMFPAHVYFGRSLFDSNKLSVIIDYKYNQDIEGYNPNSDWIVNESALAIRDEVRRVKEWLYLGRAYLKSKFLLNFVLEEAP